MVVPRALIDDVVDRIRVKAAEIRLGDPLDEATTMGPMAARGHYDRVLRCIEEGKAEGAQFVFGGGRPEHLAPGWFVEPTLFIGDNKMSIAREEIFGPVVTLIPHDGEEDAVRIANDSAYGLGGSVFSADEERARRVAASLATGSVTVNGYTTNLLAPRDPFKGSGIGTVTGVAGYQTFRSSRVINLHAAKGAWAPATLFAGAED
jgi:aldehyde dehydrogenase (NAD+)